jgi:hypothetical protein
VFGVSLVLGAFGSRVATFGMTNQIERFKILAEQHGGRMD